MNPYSDGAALYTQQAIYGRPTLPGEDENRLTYPFYSFLAHAPFIWIEYAWARAIYMVLLQVALFVGVWMCMDLFKWRPPFGLMAWVFSWSLLYYPQARGVILGQFAIFGFFSLVASLYLLKRKRDLWAGVILVISTIKPTLVFLVIPFLFLWALTRRRWAFVAGFVGSLLGLMALSWIMQPTWFQDWIYRMVLYSGYTVGQSPIWLLTHQVWPALGRAGDLVLVCAALLGMFWAWWLALRKSGDAYFFWTLGITLVVSSLVVSRSATTNYVMMLIPILWVFAALDRSPRWGRGLMVAAMVISLVGLWWLHYATVVGNQEQPIMFIPSLIVLGLVLVFGYRWLWNDAVENELAI
jgi:hypothetical protein